MNLFDWTAATLDDFSWMTTFLDPTFLGWLFSLFLVSPLSPRRWTSFNSLWFYSLSCLILKSINFFPFNLNIIHINVILFVMYRLLQLKPLFNDRCNHQHENDFDQSSIILFTYFSTMNKKIYTSMFKSVFKWMFLLPRFIKCYFYINIYTVQTKAKRKVINFELGLARTELCLYCTNIKPLDSD